MVKDANGQTIAYVYGRETRADADIAHVLTLEKLLAAPGLPQHEAGVNQNGNQHHYKGVRHAREFAGPSVHTPKIRIKIAVTSPTNDHFMAVSAPARHA